MCLFVCLVNAPHTTTKYCLLEVMSKTIHSFLLVSYYRRLVMLVLDLFYCHCFMTQEDYARFVKRLDFMLQPTIYYLSMSTEFEKCTTTNFLSWPVGGITVVPCGGAPSSFL